MKKIILLSPWKNVWVDYKLNYFKSRGYEIEFHKEFGPHVGLKADVIISAWANEYTEILGNLPKLCDKYIACLRSYEYYSGFYKKIKWDNFDHVVFCNEHIMKQADVPKSRYIPNATDVSKFKINHHKKKGNNILFLADVNHKKGIMLLAQIARALPTYNFYVAGNIQEIRFFEYLKHSGPSNIYYKGYVKDVNELFGEMHYILCTSPAEGHPNNIIEGMCAGLKPVIHRYLGYKGQFPNEYFYTTVEEARDMIVSNEWEPEKYRQAIVDNYDYTKVYQKLEELL